MSEPPRKRYRPTDEDVDRSRDSGDYRYSRDPPERNVREDRDRDRDRDRGRGGEYRRSRSRSREPDRYERGGRRNGERDRERDRRGGRRDDARYEDRDRDHDRDRDRYNDRYRDSGARNSEGLGDRKRPRAVNDERRAPRSRSRSRSPRQDRDRHGPRVRSPIPARAFERDTTARTATPPVSFTVPHADRSPRSSRGYGSGHDEDSMEGVKKSRAKAKSKTSSRQSEDPDDEVEVEEDDDMASMQAMMGFGGFGTTKQKKVAGNDVGAVRKEKKTEYRQYMNRIGGFNKPLSPTRE